MGVNVGARGCPHCITVLSAGLIPNKFLLLECSDEVIHERIGMREGHGRNWLEVHPQ